MTSKSSRSESLERVFLEERNCASPKTETASTMGNSALASEQFSICLLVIRALP